MIVARIIDEGSAKPALQQLTPDDLVAVMACRAAIASLDARIEEVIVRHGLDKERDQVTAEWRALNDRLVAEYAAVGGSIDGNTGEVTRIK